MRWVSGLLLLVVIATSGAALAAGDATVTGAATTREQVALPPGAVFEAVLEDVTDAQGPAQELGRSTIEEPGVPPYAFEIDYDTAAVLPERTYSVRAQVSVGRRLLFVSDALNPVLTGGAPREVSVRMIKVGETAAEAGAAPETIGAHGLSLPASFVGTLPCEDCDAIEYHLNMWPDQVFQLRRVWVGKDQQRDEIGRWSVDPDRHVLTLRGGGEEIAFQIAGVERLRMLAPDGTPASTADHSLTAKTLEPFDASLPMRGMLSWVADEARFTECLSGRDYPLVDDEGDYASLEHAYLAAGAESGGGIMASFDGTIANPPNGDDDAVPTVVVERFVGVWPGETCERATDKASLTNTYWKILRLGETEVAAAEGQREPNLILREGAQQFTATVGCNALTGRYELGSHRLRFGPAAATRMACPPPLDDWERLLVVVTERTASWRIDGQTLELLDDAGAPLALFQAVYLY
jgi:copper homeostasis protein (lipoprotein)